MTTSGATTKKSPAATDAKSVAAVVETVPPAVLETIVSLSAPPKTSLARNNLAVIIAAIVLLEGLLLAAVAFGAFPRLDKGPLLWAASVFPLVALAFVGWLLARKYHLEPESVAAASKLITPLTPAEQQNKVQREMAVLALEIAESTGYQPDDATLQEMCHTYLVAGDLALRHLDAEHQGRLRRHVALEDAPFDGVIIEETQIFAVEYKLLPAGEIRPEALQAALDKTEQAARRLRRTAPRHEFCLVLLLVVAIAPEERNRLRDSLLSRLSHAPFNVDLLLLDYNELHHAFARDLVI